MAIPTKERTPPYQKVPLGSTIEITVEPKSGNARLKGRIDRISGTTKSWQDSDLRNKTVTYKPRKSGRCTARIDSTFIGTTKGSVKVTVKIVKSNGEVFQQAWKVTLSGKSGETHRAKVVMRFRK